MHSLHVLDETVMPNTDATPFQKRNCVWITADDNNTASTPTPTPHHSHRPVHCLVLLNFSISVSCNKSWTLRLSVQLSVCTSEYLTNILTLILWHDQFHVGKHQLYLQLVSVSCFMFEPSPHALWMGSNESKPNTINLSLSLSFCLCFCLCLLHPPSCIG